MKQKALALIQSLAVIVRDTEEGEKALAALTADEETLQAEYLQADKPFQSALQYVQAVMTESAKKNEDEGDRGNAQDGKSEDIFKRAGNLKKRKQSLGKLLCQMREASQSRGGFRDQMSRADQFDAEEMQKSSSQFGFFPHASSLASCPSTS